MKEAIEILERKRAIAQEELTEALRQHNGAKVWLKKTEYNLDICKCSIQTIDVCIGALLNAERGTDE